MQPFFGPPFGSMPMQGMSQAANMLSQGAPQAANMLGGAGGQALRGGGLLSRLLGGLGGGAQSAAAASPMMSGLPSAAAAGGGMNFTTMLTNAQKVLGLTHQVVPMIQQYGPLIRNAPALWKIMMNNNSDASSSEMQPNEQEQEQIQTPVAIEETEDHIQSPITIDDTDHDNNQISQQIISNSSLENQVSKSRHPASFKPKNIQGIPGPKLYI
ncbi:YqfQ family protein [Alkalihalobacillus sp. MEB130]|uniref:VrrA/YqfQ family protein n=1 Tax=Alkalihalobacillus sp. MEB130 TaxID=2976704 RepID=UPI0028DD6C96|nr:VrrA/YqfQ family protein [Alkalihalobacillus sp. MEB130]MDT8861764.1 YqfQ family protein [Alkalihalobacillus sp. MEB130]